MTDPKKSTAKPAAEAIPDVVKTKLIIEPRSASASTDPAVHKLLADRQTHALNGDTDAVARVDEDLVKLGFTF